MGIASGQVSLTVWIGTMFGCLFTTQAFINYWAARQEADVKRQFLRMAHDLKSGDVCDKIFSSLHLYLLVLETTESRVVSMSHLRSLIVGWSSSALMCIVVGGSLEFLHSIQQIDAQFAKAASVFHAVAVILCVVCVTFTIATAFKFEGGKAIIDLIRPRFPETGPES